MTDCLVGALVFLFHGSNPGKLLAATFQCQFSKCIAGSRSRRRAKHFNSSIWQRSVYLLPGGVGVFDQLTFFLAGNLCGQCEENILAGQVHWCSFYRVGKNNTVVTDVNFNNLFYTVALAQLELRRFHTAGSIGDIRIACANTGAEQLHAATGTRGLNFRGRLATCTSIALGNNG